MPKVKRQIGNKTFIGLQERYGLNIYDYEPIGKIGLKALNIPETAIYERNFPGVQQKIKFAMMLHAEVEIELAACYEFSLSSDDGSILWIDSTLVVNNDGGHQMKMKKDSIVIQKGIYPVDVWYFQGLPDRYGLMLDAKIIGKPAVCPVKPKANNTKKAPYTQLLPLPHGNTVEEIEPEKFSKTAPEKKFSLNSRILFEIGKAELKDSAITAIKKIAKIINQQPPKLIEISGHTDNTGSLELNQKLSLKRATIVMEQLQIFLKNPAIKLTAVGRGATNSITTNKTKEGRAKNRRVEITIHP